MSNIKPQNLAWINNTKGLAIFFVILGHALVKLSNINIIDDVGRLNYILNIIYSIHIYTFFVVSGYLFNSSINQIYSHGYIFDFIRKKAYRLIIPYIIWSLMQGGLLVFLSTYTNFLKEKKTIHDLINIWYEPIAQFWFLQVLFLINIILVFYFYIMPRSRYSVMLLLFINLLTIIFRQEFINSSLLYNLSTMPLYFTIGIILGKCKSKIDYFVQKKYSVLVLLGIWVVFEILIPNKNKEFSPYIDNIMFYRSIIGISFIITLFMKLEQSKTLQTKWLQKLGQHSLPIYVLHVLCGIGVITILYNILHIKNLYVLLVVALSFSMALPILLNKIARKLRIAFVFGGYTSSDSNCRI